LKAQKAPLCRDELKSVTIEAIEQAERALLAGVDYRLRCHLPYGAIGVITSEVTSCFMGDMTETVKDPSYGYNSPRGVSLHTADRFTTLHERSIAVAQSALVYSDVNFMFPPGKIAFAAVAIALEGKGFDGSLGHRMQKYLRFRFPQKSMKELCDFASEISRIIDKIGESPSVDLNKFTYSKKRSRLAAQSQAAEVRRVFALAAQFRKPFSAPSEVPVPTFPFPSRKRTREMEDQLHYQPNFKAVRVTPIPTPHIYSRW